MSSKGEFELLKAREAVEDVIRGVEKRIARTRRLYGVMSRKMEEGDEAAGFARAVAIRRLLDEADESLTDYDSHRQRLGEHVRSHPQISGGVYDDRVRAYEDLQREVNELTRHINAELAVARHRHDGEETADHRTGSWEESYDAVREAVGLLEHVLSADVPALSDAFEERDHSNGFQYPIAGFRARLNALRERTETMESIDHDRVAADAATVNAGLAADYREMVERFRDRHAELTAELATLASRLADVTDS